MDILTSSQLESMGISPDKSIKLIFQKKEFARGPSFSIQNKKTGIDFCLKEEEQGHLCLLVEDSNSVTVWKWSKISDSDSPKSKLRKKKLIDRCCLALTKCIGPMATLIVDELADDLEGMSQQEMVDAIAAQIPDPKLAKSFRQSMES